MRVRIIKSGNNVEVITYRYVPRLVHHRKKKRKLSKKKKHEFRTSRNEIRRLIDCNFSSNSVFLTLTFAKNLENIKTANVFFNLFIRRLRNHYGKNWYYLAVPEFQKRGAVHYHVLLSRTFPVREIEKLWGHGFVKINRIRKVKYIGAYVSKYLSKGRLPAGQKSYFGSRNLKRPEISEFDTLPDSMVKFLGKGGFENVELRYLRGYNSQYRGYIEYAMLS